MEPNKETIGKVVLDYSCYPGEDFYSEGADEDDLLEVVKNHKPEEFNRMIAVKNRWSTLYHLSHIRGNIVDFLPIKKTDRVLEVGAGCGAITGTLAKKAGKVTCIELSKKRTLINAYRNQDCDNVEIKVGNFQDIEQTLTEHYDYIMLIGVFEYAASYIKSDSPYEEFLHILAKHLSKNGQIAIAIENKYGMKYWAGCREDHTGRFYEGIEGYANSTGVRTFSKNGLEKIAKECGFQSEFYYPYPDYKLPITIYSDKRLPQVGELSDNDRNYDATRVVAFDETLAFDEMIRENKFPFYSNSFLVLLRQGEIIESFSNRHPVYSRHSNERADCYRIRTDIEKDGYGKQYVVKYPFSSEAAAHVKAMERAYTLQKEVYAGTKLKPNRCREKEGSEDGLEFEFLTGPTLESKLDEMYLAGKTDELKNIIIEYADCIRALPGKKPFEVTEEFTKRFGEAVLPANLESNEITNLDLIFSNIIVNDGWNVIDYEWTFDFPVPIHFVLYRAIFYFFQKEKREFLKQCDVYELLGITKQEQKAYEKMEYNFQMHIIGDKLSLIGMYSLMGRDHIPLEKLMKYGNLLPRTDRVKVYFDQGLGFQEDNVCYYTALVTGEDRVILDFVPKPDVRGLRIDPTDHPCMVMLHDLGVNEVLVNGTVLPGKTVLYDTDDPQIIMETIEPGKPVHIEYTITALRYDFFHNIMEEIERLQFAKPIKRKEPYEKVGLSGL